jgi:hypothetical protein
MLSATRIDGVNAGARPQRLVLTVERKFVAVKILADYQFKLLVAD